MCRIEKLIHESPPDVERDSASILPLVGRAASRKISEPQRAQRAQRAQSIRQ